MSIRYHEDSGHPMIHEGGAWRVLAALPGRMAYAGIQSWDASKPLVPREQWPEFSFKAFTSPVLDQGETSSCVGHASAAAFRRAWCISGQEDHAFNPFWIYGLINGGRDQGAIVGDAVDAMTKYGVAYDGPVADGDLPHQLYFPQQLQAMPATLAKAKRFRVVECWHLRGPRIFDQIGSALALGYVCVSGILVGQNFGQLDAEGVAPLPDTVLGGHALHHLGLKQTRAGAWVIETQNSWSQEWGLSGYCYLQQGAWSGGMSDAFAILADSVDPQDTLWPDAGRHNSTE